MGEIFPVCCGIGVERTTGLNYFPARVCRTGVLRRGGRVVECTGLENQQAARSRGFESHPLYFFKLHERGKQGTQVSAST